MLDYLPELLKGLHTSLTLTVASIIVALILSLIFTIILTLKTPGLVWIVRGYITLFTGTPLLVQIFLIYYGPGQFPSLQDYPWLWHLISEPWLCALIALSLNSAASHPTHFTFPLSILPAPGSSAFRYLSGSPGIPSDISGPHGRPISQRGRSQPAT